jgi:hypothetical protein
MSAVVEEGFETAQDAEVDGPAVANCEPVKVTRKQARAAAKRAIGRSKQQDLNRQTAELRTTQAWQDVRSREARQGHCLNADAIDILAHIYDAFAPLTEDDAQMEMHAVAGAPVVITEQAPTAALRATTLDEDTDAIATCVLLKAGCDWAGYDVGILASEVKSVDEDIAALLAMQAWLGDNGDDADDYDDNDDILDVQMLAARHPNLGAHNDFAPLVEDGVQIAEVLAAADTPDDQGVTEAMAGQCSGTPATLAYNTINASARRRLRDELRGKPRSCGCTNYGAPLSLYRAARVVRRQAGHYLFHNVVPQLCACVCVLVLVLVFGGGFNLYGSEGPRRKKGVRVADTPVSSPAIDEVDAALARDPEWRDESSLMQHPFDKDTFVMFAPSATLRDEMLAERDSWAPQATPSVLLAVTNVVTQVVFPRIAMLCEWRAHVHNFFLRLCAHRRHMNVCTADMFRKIQERHDRRQDDLQKNLVKVEENIQAAFEQVRVKYADARSCIREVEEHSRRAARITQLEAAAGHALLVDRVAALEARLARLENESSNPSALSTPHDSLRQMPDAQAGAATTTTVRGRSGAAGEATTGSEMRGRSTTLRERVYDAQMDAVRIRSRSPGVDARVVELEYHNVMRTEPEDAAIMAPPVMDREPESAPYIIGPFFVQPPFASQFEDEEATPAEAAAGAECDGSVDAGVVEQSEDDDVWNRPAPDSPTIAWGQN